MTAMRGQERGSIVIEAMIAAAIVAAMLGAAFEAVQATSRNVRLAEARRDAMLVAQSTMALVGIAIPVVPGATGGGADALHWRVDIVRTEVPPGPAGSVDLVTVTVMGPDASPPLARLRSLRLGR